MDSHTFLVNLFSIAHRVVIRHRAFCLQNSGQSVASQHVRYVVGSWRCHYSSSRSGGTVTYHRKEQQEIRLSYICHKSVTLLWNERGRLRKCVFLSGKTECGRRTCISIRRSVIGCVSPPPQAFQCGCPRNGSFRCGDLNWRDWVSGVLLLNLMDGDGHLFNRKHTEKAMRGIESDSAGFIPINSERSNQTPAPTFLPIWNVTSVMTDGSHFSFPQQSVTAFTEVMPFLTNYTGSLALQKYS